jgi:hypothetical protein
MNKWTNNGTWKEFLEALGSFVLAVIILIVLGLALFQLGNLVQGIGVNQ